ncbi:MAG: hypothetical protein R3Y19_06605 [Rikenellaceae bacterium]
MTNRKVAKKRVVISQENLTDQLREALKEQYPLGLSDHMIRIDKPNGDFFNAVTLEMPEVCYLVKVKVKVDTNPQEEFDKDTFDEESDQVKDASDLADVLAAENED